MVQPLIEAQRHELMVSLPRDAVSINGDPVRIAQIIANLLNNAAKYTDPGGRIELSVQVDHGSLASPQASSKDSRWLVMTVRDNGLGIDPDLLPRVFDLFTQADRSLERSQGGLGIGLTLVKRLVELHGGIVTAHSEGAGCGSEFVIRLPAKAHQSTDKTAVPVKAEEQRLRILVVDDNAAATRILTVLLRKIGNHEVRVAPDGPTALQLADEFRPSLILLDIGLPRMNGYEVARQLRTNPDFDKTLLAAATGYGTEDDRRRSLKAGFDVHLIKPVSLDHLRELLAHPKLAKSPAAPRHS